MVEVLAVIGALWTSLSGIIQSFGTHYQIFTYDKSLLKRLFFEDTNTGSDGDDGDNTGILGGGTITEKE